MAKKRKLAKLEKFLNQVKHVPAYLYIIGGFVIFCIIFSIYLFFNPGPTSIYISSGNPKQGDTVFIRVRSEAKNVMGSFGNEKLVFYKKGPMGYPLSEWISILGIDADQNPGSYKILINASGTELEEEIKVRPADFSSLATSEAPILSQNGTTQKKAVDNVVKKDNPSLSKVLIKLTSQPYFSSSFVFPLNPLKKIGYSFGRFIGFDKDKLQHLGVDLRAGQGSDVYAVNQGKVVATLDLSNYGKTVIIDHGLNIFSLYLHLDRFNVSVGQLVKKNQIIGLSGSTGYVTGPHLHFSMRVGTARVDPITFVETTKKMDDNFIIADISNAFLNLINFKY